MRAKQNLVANVTYRTTEVRPLAWDSVARHAAMTDAAMREASIWGVWPGAGAANRGRRPYNSIPLSESGGAEP